MTPSTRPESDADWLAAWLRDRDTACPLCGYNLRGLTMPRCPECGNELRLCVQLADPYMSPWITLAAAVCAAGGAGVFLLAIILADGRWPPVSALCGLTMIGFIIAISMAGIVLRTRRPFQRLGRRAQWKVAITALIGTVFNTCLFAATAK